MRPAPRTAIRSLFLLIRLGAVGVACTLLVAWVIALNTDLAARPQYACEVPPKAYHTSVFWTGRVGIESRRGSGYEYYFTHFEHRHPVTTPISSLARGTHVPQIAAAWSVPQIAPWRAGRPWPHGDRRTMQGIFACGWPRAAFFATYTSHRQPGMLNPYRGGIEIPGRRFGNLPRLLRVLPYQPVWSGLIVDTCLYAAASGVCCMGFTQVRSLARRRRQCCQRCAYDLLATPPPSCCPECGYRSAHR